MSWVGGPSEQVTKHGGSAAYPSPDGQWIYYMNRVPGPLRRIKPDGSGDALVVDREINNFQFTAVPDGIYWFASSGQKPRLQRLTEDGRTENLMELGFTPGLGLSVSRNGRSVLVTRPDENGTDLMLVEGFR